MGSVVSHPKSATPGANKSRGGTFVWIAVAIALVIAIIAFVVLHTESRTRERASVNAQTPPPSPEESTQLIKFTEADIQVSTGWTFLAGRHPSVTFTCRLAPDLQSANVAILCYRPLGVTEWFTAETHPHRDGTCRITLRDLYRDMNYECFFLASTRDTVIQSRTVQFSTR